MVKSIRINDNPLFLPVTVAIIAFLVLFIYYQYTGYRIKNATEYLSVSQFPDTPLYDAFGRARVSQPYIIFESKQTHDNDPLKWDETLYSGDTTSGVSIVSNYEINRASTTLKSTAGISGNYIRQTFRTFDYHPGKSQQIMMTANLIRQNLSPPLTGVEIGLGMYDFENGLFFKYANDTMNVVIRSFVTGVTVDNLVPQNQWNIDKMDGKGPSKIVANWNTVQIYAIDFSWLGVGRVRFCLIIDGVVYSVHEFLSANILTSVYMSRPNLPLRFELTTTTDSPVVWSEQICATVSSEGGTHLDTGELKSLFTENTIPIADVNADYVLLSIRRKSDHPGVTIIPTEVNVFNIEATADLASEWYLVFDPTYVGGDPTYTELPNSGIEYYEGLGTSTGLSISGGEILTGGYNISGRQGTGERSSSNELINNLLLMGTSIGGGQQSLAVVTKSLQAGQVDLRAMISWKEL